MRRPSTVLAIASGKGGVGKSVAAANLAVRLAAAGHRTALIDAAFGQGACSVLLNESPRATVLDVTLGRATYADALHPTAYGFDLVEAVAEDGVPGHERPPLFATMDRLIDQLRPDYRYILIDAPSGTEDTVRWALDRADLGAVVVVGEPTAIADAYRLCKLTWQAAPSYPLGLIVNFADEAEEARSIADRFAVITEKFTGRAPFYLGWLPFDAAIRRSVREQRPFALSPGPATSALDALAGVLVQGRSRSLIPQRN